MPNRCINNGLNIESIPMDLAALTCLENQLIARYLLFMKIKTVPKSGIELMADRTVLVPVEPTDIVSNVETLLLPRTMEESAVISVKLKRMKGLKKTHIEAYVRPEVIFKALATLKAIGNKHYENILNKQSIQH